jgi:hypothetical protein
MNIIRTALMFSLMIPLFAGCTTLRTAESLDWNPGVFTLADREKTGWKGVRGDEMERLIYAKEGETYKNWTEKAEATQVPIAITFLNFRTRWNPESIMNSEKRRMQKDGCSTEGWTVLQKDERSILYEWRDIRCPGRFTQDEIVRVVMGRWYSWFISFGMRDKNFSSDEKQERIENLMRAKVVEVQ